MATSGALEIHGYVACPFAWRVRLAAAEKGLTTEWLPCDVDEPDPRARAHNPEERSPLLYDAGFTLPESEVIAQYLDEGFDGRALMPAQARARAELRALWPRLRALDVHTEPSRPEARRRSEPGLRLLEDRLADAAYIHGDQPGLTDLLFWPFLANLGVRGLLDEARFPAAAATLRRAVARAPFQSTKPPWAERLR